MHLVCDLGGTNCRVGLVAPGDAGPVETASFPNADFPDLATLLTAYGCARGRPAVDTVVIALAAPVDGNRIELTNRDWVVDRAAIASATGARSVRLVNDFEALGHALGEVERLQLVPLSGAARPASGTRIVLGSGTGFNCAARLAGGSVLTCEAGHSTLAPVTALERRLQARFTERHGRCSVERLLSGSGLFAIHEAIRQSGTPGADLPDSHAVTQAATAGGDPAATAAAEAFCTLLGRVTGDLGLLFLPLGGVFITGGVARGLTEALAAPNGGFIRAFRDKGRMAAFMSRFPVFLIRDDCAALHGCAALLDRPHNESEPVRADIPAS